MTASRLISQMRSGVHACFPVPHMCRRRAFLYNTQRRAHHLKPLMKNAVHSCLPEIRFHPLSPDKMDDFVFVTAASSNHFTEEIDAIASIQTLMPEKKIIFFDIGLEPDQIAEVRHFILGRPYHVPRVCKCTIAAIKNTVYIGSLTQ